MAPTLRVVHSGTDTVPQIHLNVVWDRSCLSINSGFFVESLGVAFTYLLFANIPNLQYLGWTEFSNSINFVNEL